MAHSSSTGSTAPLVSHERVLLALLVGVSAASYSLTGVFRHRHFGSSVDLGIFDQAVWHLSRFEAPASSIRGFSNLFGDHFHPIIVLFAPFYWLAPAAETLVVSQAILFAISVIPVYLFLRARLPWRVAMAMSAAYALFWGLQRAANFDVHEMAFAPPVIATALYAMDRRRWTLFWISCLGVALVKEDMVPFLTGLGLYLIGTGERTRGAMLVGGSLIGFYLIVAVFVPWFAHGAPYSYLGDYGLWDRPPWEVAALVVTPPAKLQTVLLWLAPFAFLPLRSPLVFTLVPLALVRLLSESPNHWGTSFHYSAPLAPILAMSAGDGLARLTRGLTAARSRRLLAGAAIACVLLSSLLPGRQPHWRLLSPGHYHPTPFEEKGREVLELIPDEASVVAQTSILPHLGQRQAIYILDERAPDADFVVASTHLSPWPLSSWDEIASMIEKWRQRGYRTVIDEDGWRLLQRDGPRHESR